MPTLRFRLAREPRTDRHLNAGLRLGAVWNLVRTGQENTERRGDECQGEAVN